MDDSDFQQPQDWRRRLRELPSGTQSNSSPVVKWLFRVFLGSVCLLIAAVVFFGWAAFGDHIEQGSHFKSVEWLPQTASDISFYRNRNIGNVFAYEFRISKPDFEELARKRGWLVKPVTDPKVITRYTLWLPPNHPGKTEPTLVGTDSGLYYESRRGNGGGISVLYDGKTSIAYVLQNTR